MLNRKGPRLASAFTSAASSSAFTSSPVGVTRCSLSVVPDIFAMASRML